MKKRLFLVAILALAVVAGIVTAVCFLTDPVDKNPDDATQQTDPSDATESTEPTNPSKGQTIQVAEPFASVLNSKKPFYFENEGKSVLLSDYYKSFWKLTSVDIDHDGNKEIAVMFHGAGGGDGTLILWQHGGSVFGYEFGFRALYRINKDGTFLWNTDSGNTYGCSSIAFVGTEVKTTELWRVEHNDGSFTSYIDNKLVSQEQMNAFPQYRDLEEVEWTVFGSNTTIVGSPEEWKEPENPYAIREITDGRVIAGEKNQTYKDSFVSLDFPLGWKCLEQWGEDGRFIYFQDPALGENCQLSIYFAGATIYTYDYTREDYMAHFSGYYGYKDVVIDSFAKETIQGFPCTKIAYSYTEDTIRFVGTRYDDLIEESRLYHITITYPAAESKTYEKEFAAIIESVQFLKSNQVDISSLPLKEAYDYAFKMYVAGPASKYRDVGDLQIETSQIITLGGKYYQSYVASNVDIRYIWISRSEFPDNNTALWDWYAVGTAKDYSLDLLGKIDEGRSDNETTEKTYTFTDVGLTVHSTADKSAFSQPISCTYSGKTITLTPHFTGIPVTAVYYSQNYWFNERGVWVNVSTDAGGRDFLVDKNGKIVADSYFQISTGGTVTPSTIGAEYSAGEGLYVYTDGTLYGLKNSAGTVITQPLYRRTLINFFGGYAVAERADGTFVAIDTTGKEYGTLPGGRSNGDKTFLDQEGEPGNYTQYLYDLQGNRISGGYDSISYFHDGLALIKKGNKLGLISADGTVVLEPCIECDVVTYPPKGRGFSYAFMDQNAFVIPIGGEIAVITVDK